MHLVKLNAIDSTNDFLKALANKQFVENFTVVTAESQTKGKGQMGAAWTSEAGKNLTMSVLIKDAVAEITQIFTLNIAVALAILKALEQHNVPDLSIKWPNDIMSGSKKIGGILIENSIKSDGSVQSVVGFGLNVNQRKFDNLPKASSLALVSDAIFDRQALLVAIVESMKTHVRQLSEDASLLWQQYQTALFKKGVPMVFENQSGTQFMGIIHGVGADGKLQVQLEDDSISCFGIKEIQMLY